MDEHRYPTVVYWSAEDDGWIADVPDLRSCSAHGDSPDEALAEARVATALWLERAREHGDPIPTPTSHPVLTAAAG